LIFTPKSNITSKYIVNKQHFTTLHNVIESISFVLAVKSSFLHLILHHCIHWGS